LIGNSLASSFVVATPIILTASLDEIPKPLAAGFSAYKNPYLPLLTKHNGRLGIVSET